jgi:hypothetical protein
MWKLLPLKKNLLQDYLQDVQIFLNLQIQFMIIRQYTLKLQTKINPSKLILITKVKNKKKNSLLHDYPQGNLINQNPLILHMIIKQFIIRQLIRINHFKQIPPIRGEIKKENNLLRDYHQENMTNQNHQIQNTIIKLSMFKQQIKINHIKLIQIIKREIKNLNSLLLGYHLENMTNRNQVIKFMIHKQIMFTQEIMKLHFSQTQIMKKNIKKQKNK